MKELSITSAIIVFVFSLCYLMGPMIHCCSANQESEGLACYCCSDTDHNCAMYMCSKCNHHNRSDDSVWLFDTMVSAFTLSVPFQPLYLTAEKTATLKTKCCKVPYKPPKS
jgi:hypothetical protein